MSSKPRVNMLRIKPANRRKAPQAPRRAPEHGQQKRACYNVQCTYTGMYYRHAWVRATEEQKSKGVYLRRCRIIKTNYKVQGLHIIEFEDGATIHCSDAHLRELNAHPRKLKS